MSSVSIHGHALLNHIIDQHAPVALDALRNWAIATHGPNARYHTCSTSDLTLDGILTFFQERSKVIVQGNSVLPAIDHVCGHHDASHSEVHDEPT